MSSYEYRDSRPICYATLVLKLDLTKTFSHPYVIVPAVSNPVIVAGCIQKMRHSIQPEKIRSQIDGYMIVQK